MTQQPVGLRELLEAACRSAAPEFARRNAKLDPDFTSGENLILDGDAGALEQLFLNLLINAAQALPAGGEARVTASRRDGYVDVTITDNGVGMSARQLAEVGEPFRSSRRDGTGLGLKIARRIAATHRGAIDVASTSGVGTTVRVSLPLAQPRVHPRPSDQRRG
jgi:cell cycle sensor histidine kinase DivJ